MTITYDADATCDTVAAACYDDPDTYTIAEAWMSSPLGELDDQITEACPLAETSHEGGTAGSRGKLFAAVAAGVIGGATLGAVLFGYRSAAPPTVVVPGFGLSTQQLPPSNPPSGPTAPQKPATGHSPASVPVQQGAPNSPADESKTNEDIAAAPAPLPAAAPPVVVDVYVPPLGEKPKAPEPPKPEPPVFDPPNNVVAQIPEPDPGAPNVVMEAPIADPGLTKVDADALKPVRSSRFTVNMPKTKTDEPQRQVSGSRFNSIAKP